MYQLIITKTNRRYDLHACMINKDNHSKLVQIEKDCDLVICNFSTTSIFTIDNLKHFAIDIIVSDPEIRILELDKNQIRNELETHFKQNCFELLTICLN